MQSLQDLLEACPTYDPPAGVAAEEEQGVVESPRLQNISPQHNPTTDSTNATIDAPTTTHSKLLDDVHARRSTTNAPRGQAMSPLHLTASSNVQHTPNANSQPLGANDDPTKEPARDIGANRLCKRHSSSKQERHRDTGMDKENDARCVNDAMRTADSGDGWLHAELETRSCSNSVENGDPAPQALTDTPGQSKPSNGGGGSGDDDGRQRQRLVNPFRSSFNICKPQATHVVEDYQTNETRSPATRGAAAFPCSKCARLQIDLEELRDQIVALKFALASAESENFELTGELDYKSCKPCTTENACQTEDSLVAEPARPHGSDCVEQGQTSCQGGRSSNSQRGNKVAAPSCVNVTQSFQLVGSGLSVLDTLPREAKCDVIQCFREIRNGDDKRTSIQNLRLDGELLTTSYDVRDANTWGRSHTPLSVGHAFKFDDSQSECFTPKSKGSSCWYDSDSSDDGTRGFRTPKSRASCSRRAFDDREGDFNTPKSSAAHPYADFDDREDDFGTPKSSTNVHHNASFGEESEPESPERTEMVHDDLLWLHRGDSDREVPVSRASVQF